MHAVAALAFRSALRSRLVLSMALLILLVTFGLPATIEGDGTLSGTVRVLLDYTLGLTIGLLSVAMLWSACAGIATEIEQGQLRLIRVHPIHAFEIWLGKWFGLLMLSGALLALTGLGTYGMLHWKLHRADATPAEHATLAEQVLVGQRALAPRGEDLTEASEQRLAEYAAQGWNPEVVSRRKALLMIHQRVLAERATVAPGAARTWIVDIPERIAPTASVKLRIRLSPSWGAARPLAGQWRIGPEGEPAAGATVPSPRIDQGLGHVTIDPTWIRAGHALRLEFINTPATDNGTVAFDIDQGIQILIQESGFGSNLLRALLVLWFKIGLLCALGLAASTCFSFPVAAFGASATVLLALTGHYFTATEASDIMTLAAQQVSKPSLLQDFSEAALRGFETIAAPAVGESPLTALSDGILISWGRTAHDFIVLIVLYSGSLAAASAWLLHRRELASNSR